MAITRENIAHFYEKYKENLKTEESVIEQFTKADTKENWVANLKKKYRSMRQLYIENEALLNLYIRPFTEGRMELNDELADEFLKQIRDASAQGYEDSLSMLELAEVLEQYFLKHGKRDNYIWTINLLGGIHNAMPDRQDGEKAAWYFQKLRSFKDCYFEIENDDVSSFWEKSAVQSFLRVEGYKAFCDYAIAHDTMEHEDGFTESRLFQVAINHLPSIIDILNQYEAEYHGDPGLRKSCVDEYLKMIRQIPRTGNSNFLTYSHG